MEIHLITACILKKNKDIDWSKKNNREKCTSQVTKNSVHSAYRKYKYNLSSTHLRWDPG